MPYRFAGWNPKMLRSLQYFEAVARLGSVAAAAESLGVSPSAVSHQIKSLKDYLGEDVFVRSGRGIALSDRGQRLQEQVASAFSDIAAAVVDVVGEKRVRLRVAVCTSFGPHWLVKRLPDFYRENPQCDIELRLYTKHPEQTDSVADAIVTANAVADGFDSVDILQEVLVAVRRPGLSTSDNPAPTRLVTTDIPPAHLGEEWLNFGVQSKLGVGRMEDMQFVRCTHFVLALELAKAGMGYALIPDFLADEALKKGDLEIAYPERLPSGRTYRLCYKISRNGDPDLRAFARWLKLRGSPGTIQNLGK